MDLSPPKPFEPPVPDGEAAEITCVFCHHKGAIRFEWRHRWRVKPLGTFSISGGTIKYSGYLDWWPWAVCRLDLGGCGRESEGKPA